MAVSVFGLIGIRVQAHVEAVHRLEPGTVVARHLHMAVPTVPAIHRNLKAVKKSCAQVG